jgi:hypothetical protein
MIELDDVDKEVREFVYNRQKQELNRCFWPTDKCTNKAIKAHSIQNNGILDSISTDGHLIMLKARQNLDTGPVLFFKRIGRNVATIFTGLCGEHDNRLFKPIDNSKIDIKNKEHLFLIAYRSVLRELHAKMVGAAIVQQIYSKGVEVGRVDPSQVDEAMMKATIPMMEAYSFYRYKYTYDVAYVKKQYNILTNHVIEVEYPHTVLAVSAIYDLFDNMRKLEDRLDPKCICLNVFPQDDKLIIVYSYIKEHDRFFKNHVAELENARGEYKLYLLSKRILMFSENFVLKPDHVNRWTEHKKNAIKAYFSKNTATKIDYDDKDLFLF